MKKLRIAVWHNLPSGGGKRALYYHVRALVERGHEVEAWCPPTADQSYLPLGDFAQEHIIPLDAFQRTKATTPFGKLINGLSGFTQMMKAMEKHSRECAKQINLGDFDLFFGNSCLFLRASPIARYIKIPSVLYLQEPFRWLYEALPKLPWAAPEYRWNNILNPVKIRTILEDIIRVQNSRLQVREELRSVLAYDLVLANSYFSRESMIRAYGIDARVCYLGVDSDLFENGSAQRESIILGIGSFDYIKNIDFVLRAVALLPDLHPEVVWIGNSGDSKYLQSLVALASELGVLFRPLQRVPDSEMVDLLKRSSVLAYAPRLEPFGFAPLEANCCGLPVVAVAEGGVRETVIDGVTGLLVDADEEAMSVALRRLLEDSSYAEQLGRQGREIALQNWGLSRSIDRLVSQFNHVLEP